MNSQGSTLLSHLPRLDVEVKHLPLEISGISTLFCLASLQAELGLLDLEPYCTTHSLPEEYCLEGIPVVPLIPLCTSGLKSLLSFDPQPCPPCCR